jgi:hypothetical protein
VVFLGAAAAVAEVAWPVQQVALVGQEAREQLLSLNIFKELL